MKENTEKSRSGTIGKHDGLQFTRVGVYTNLLLVYVPTYLKRRYV